MNTNQELRTANEENDERAFYEFKNTTTSGQKDAVLFFLTVISRADKLENPHEAAFIEQMEAFLYNRTAEH